MFKLWILMFLTLIGFETLKFIWKMSFKKIWNVQKIVNINWVQNIEIRSIYRRNKQSLGHQLLQRRSSRTPTSDFLSKKIPTADMTKSILINHLTALCTFAATRTTNYPNGFHLDELLFTLYPKKIHFCCQFRII